MLRLLAAILGLCLFTGCAIWGPPPPVIAQFENPVMFPIADRDYAFDQVIDVVDNFFRIRREDRVRLIGDIETEGRIETFYEVGSTYFEPWRRDSVGVYERTESTLQSIRRWAIVRVIPAATGYLVDVTVYKELEDLIRPEQATVGAATFRYDDSLTPYTEPVGGQPYTVGWIPQGRDTALEQKIIGQLLARAGQENSRNSSWQLPLPKLIRQESAVPETLPPVGQELPPQSVPPQGFGPPQGFSPELPVPEGFAPQPSPMQPTAPLSQPEFTTPPGGFGTQ